MALERAKLTNPPLPFIGCVLQGGAAEARNSCPHAHLLSPIPPAFLQSAAPCYGEEICRLGLNVCVRFKTQRLEGIKAVGVGAALSQYGLCKLVVCYGKYLRGSFTVVAAFGFISLLLQVLLDSCE